MTHDEIVRELRIAADQLDFIPPTSDCAALREIIPRLRTIADLLDRAPEPPAAAPEVRLNDDGTLDEVVAHGADVHLEQLADDQWWLAVGEVRLVLSSRGKITATMDAATRGNA